MIFGIEIGGDQIISFIAGAVFIGGTVVGIYDKRRRELTETYKGLYEGKSEEVEVLRDKVNRLEARVEFFESGFTRGLAEGVVNAVWEILRTQDQPRT